MIDNLELNRLKAKRGSLLKSIGSQPQSYPRQVFNIKMGCFVT
jgi:hypothetical protein